MGLRDKLSPNTEVPGSRYSQKMADEEAGRGVPDTSNPNSDLKEVVEKRGDGSGDPRKKQLKRRGSALAGFFALVCSGVAANADGDPYDELEAVADWVSDRAPDVPGYGAGDVTDTIRDAAAAPTADVAVGYNQEMAEATRYAAEMADALL